MGYFGTTMPQASNSLNISEKFLPTPIWSTGDTLGALTGSEGRNHDSTFSRNTAVATDRPEQLTHDHSLSP